MARLVTPVRTQAPGDVRCVAFAVAAAIETSVCRNLGQVAGAPEIDVDELFELGGSVAGAIDGLQDAVVDGVPDLAIPPGLWKARIRAVGGPRKQRVDLMRRELRDNGPLVALIEVFSNFPTFTGAGVYAGVKPSVGFHALCIVGDEVDAGGATGRWIAKNSMGTAWGDAGFGRFAWNDKLVRLEDVVFVVDEVRQ
jgi:hypothetical protein